MRYAITISYDGTPFCGWQAQKDRLSVQTELETAAGKLFNTGVSMTASGRTDAGVHALAQVAHFDLERSFDISKIVSGLNYFLPETIRVNSAKEVNGDFHARKSVKKKTYMYLMYKAQTVNPLLNRRALLIDPDTDTEKMAQAAESFIGTHDFSAFKKSGSSAKTSTRTVFDCRIEQQGNFVALYITADGFLYNMVRIITAQVLAAAQGKKDFNIEGLLKSKDRTLTKEVAPPWGLYLYNVEY